jgi:hypothetical protein
MSRWTLLLLAACSNASPAHPDAPFVAIDSPSGGSADAPVDAAAVAEMPLAYTGGTYTNSFDGLPTVAMSSDMLAQTLTGKGPFPFSDLTGMMATTGMDGWELANPDGSSADTELRVHDGSLSGSMGRGVISFGTDGQTDRALGTLPTSNQIGRFGLLLKNTTSGTLSQLTVAYTGEQWRRGDVTTPDSLTFEYGVADSLDAGGLTADTDLTFTAPVTAGTNVAVDGNAAASHVSVSKTITGVAWTAGSVLVLRWTATSGTGKDDGLAIDDVSFSAHP